MEAKIEKTSIPGRKRLRAIERQKQQDRKRWLFFSVCFAAVAAIVLAVVFAPKPEPVEFDYRELPMLGSADAPVKIVEFGDFKCPACRYFSEQIKPQLVQDYIDKGTVALYFMNNTIIGPDSFAAAMAGQSIYHQNKNEFWKFYDAIYKNQGDERLIWATPEYLVELAKNAQLQVDYEKLKQDIENEAYADVVIAQNAKAEKLITATPTLFINGVKFVEFADYDKLKSQIAKAEKKAQ
ncbi:DsbA family protein [Paenibacillus montanisoli]|uniref:DsbA family protein n=1 Tax=Paenibacillus montanisoli TaxID=2081970 RepID=A0A328UAD9_9BACL|nr:thioredoxin domain-containing protein [Paenibacillus montanisoli]RAP77214.1 DsbA family protein [Paenibacillus montanisoli]